MVFCLMKIMVKNGDLTISLWGVYSSREKAEAEAHSYGKDVISEGGAAGKILTGADFVSFMVRPEEVK